MLERESVLSGDRTSAPTWAGIDRNLRAIARKRAALEEYLERALGYGPHAAADRLRVAEALVELPAMRSALGAGELTYSAGPRRRRPRRLRTPGSRR